MGTTTLWADAVSVFVGSVAVSAAAVAAVAAVAAAVAAAAAAAAFALGVRRRLAAGSPGAWPDWEQSSSSLAYSSSPGMPPRAAATGLRKSMAVCARRCATCWLAATVACSTAFHTKQQSVSRARVSFPANTRQTVKEKAPQANQRVRLLQCFADGNLGQARRLFNGDLPGNKVFHWDVGSRHKLAKKLHVVLQMPAVVECARIYVLLRIICHHGRPPLSHRHP